MGKENEGRQNHDVAIAKIAMIVTLKSKCGILQGVIILLMVFVKKEMKVMNNNNAVEEILVTRTLTQGL